MLKTSERSWLSIMEKIIQKEGKQQADHLVNTPRNFEKEDREEARRGITRFNSEASFSPIRSLSPPMLSRNKVKARAFTVESTDEIKHSPRISVRLSVSSIGGSSQSPKRQMVMPNGVAHNQGVLSTGSVNLSIRDQSIITQQ